MKFFKAAIILAYVLMTLSSTAQEVRLEVRSTALEAPQVVLTDGDADLAKLPLPSGVTAQEAEAAVENACWSPARDAVILSIPSGGHTFLTSVVRTPAGEYVVSDLTFAEAANFSKLGRVASSYQRFQTTPLALRARADGAWQVSIETKVWEADLGTRERVSEPLIISAHGAPLAS